MPSLREVGEEYENRAATFLLEKGYTIITRRFHARVGELDLVALDDDEIVFVEVKARLSAEFSPEEAVGAEKIRRLHRAANRYLLETESEGRPYRFDLIAIDPQGIRHYERAF